MAVATGTALAIAGGAAAAGGAYQSRQARKAAEAEQRGLEQGREQQLEMFYTAREDLAPWRSAGLDALNVQRQYLGLPPLETPVATTREGKTLADLQSQAAALRGEIDKIPQPLGKRLVDRLFAQKKQEKQTQLSDLESQISALEEQQKPYETIDVQADLETTPGYQFQMGEGLKALERQLGPAGASGRAMKAIQRFGQGLANNTFTQRLQQLANLASGGQNAAAMQSNQAINMGGNLANIAASIGASEGNQRINQANILGNLASQIGMVAGYGSNPSFASPETPPNNFNFNPFNPQPRYDVTPSGTYNLGF